MAGFDKSKCREFFRIPDGYEPWTMIAVGYFDGPAEEAELERSRRTRLPLHRIAFHGKWDKPLPGESAQEQNEHRGGNARALTGRDAWGRSCERRGGSFDVAVQREPAV